ncbi:uncharacterized protein LOC111334626 [Stylophora pistillata]|uniref:uncharacterized protein LOC111334626 n=1 Tax=Stylophora pistillata TaxID=50429 RepID=UPI000C04B7EF|nr:uncharacterized protein LOC111334626 [Stylophora pistillata]
MNVHFYLLSMVVFTSMPVKSDRQFMEEPRTEVEYQPIGEVERKEVNESSVSEVSSNPLPAEPKHAQVVSIEHVSNIDPSQTSMPASVSVHLPEVPTISGRPPGSEEEPVSPLALEPEPPVVQLPQLPFPLTTPSTSTPAGCHKMMDLGILMDSSRYVSPSLWEQEKSIVVTLMEKLDITPLGTHSSVITFSSEVEFPIPFNGYKDKVDLKRKVAELPYNYRDGLSRIDLGLTAVMGQMFVPRDGVRNLNKVPRALLVLTNGRTDGSQSAKIFQAVDDLKDAQIKVMFVKLGNLRNQDFSAIARSNSLVFSENDIEGLSEALLDTCAEICSNEKSTKPVTLAASVPPTAPTPPPWPAPQPPPAPYPAPIPQPPSQCLFPECKFPLVCVQASIYATCVPPPAPSASTNNSCSTHGPCLTTVIKTATDTTTLVSTSTQTETSTAVATITNTERTTNTALTTQTHTQTDVVTATSTLTTTNTQVATSTYHTTETSTAVLTSHQPVTSTKTLTTTSTRIVNTTDTHTMTTTDVIRTTATTTNIVTSTANKTNTHTLTTTKTDTVTSTGITTSALLTTATTTNTVNTTHLATKTLTKTLTTVATQTSTSTYNATNVITATTTSTATATSTAVLTATSTAKTTETMTATSTAVLTQTLTNTHNQTLTQTKTLTATSTSVVTTCSANCTKIEPTPSRSTNTPTVSSSMRPEPEAPGCAVNYTKLGCFKDDRKKPRPLPELLFTDRDSRSEVFSGKTIDWNNWDTYMIDLVCRCAKAAKAKKYNYFSLQYFGECWSGPEAGETYNRAGSSDKCVTKGFKKCDPSNKQECVGDKNINFVYGIDVTVPVTTPTQTPSTTPPVTSVTVSTSTQPPSPTSPVKPEPTPSHPATPVVSSSVTPNPATPGCTVNYTKLGCFKDDRKKPRPLPELLFTDRDSRSKVFSGKTIDWNNWDKYMIDLVCRCAKAAKVKKYNYFSLQHFGECWSGPEAGETYNRAGSSDKCVTKGFEKCDPNDKQECVGDKKINFVYGIDVTGTVITPTKPATPTPPEEPLCDQALDIGVVIDSSDSITLEDYNLCLNFVADLAKRFKVSEQETHFGAIVFSTTPQLQFSFADKEFYKLKRLRKKIRSFPYLAEGTRTDLALTLADLELFSEQGGDRLYKPDVLIVITDGRTHPVLSKPYPEVLQPLQAKNVSVIAVGVGKDADSKELTAIAMNDKSHVLKVDQYKDLVKILDVLLKESCNRAKPLTAIKTPPLSPTMAANLRKCNIEYQKLGCFVDKERKTSALALPEKMLNEIVNWDQWNVWLPDFVCRCANLVYEKNYHVFGIHFFGECWSGVKAGDTYNMYGAAEQCLDTNQQQCGAQSVGDCSGDQNSSFVYRIVISQGAQVEPSPVPETAIKRDGLKENCLVDFTKRGCFKDLQSRRPLPQLMLTDLDMNNAKFSGFSVDWGSWNSYLEDVVCRCAQISRSKGFDYFGLANFGECWSGKDAGKTYEKESSSPFCITKEFAECNTEDESVCSGNKTTAFIYSVKENMNTKKGNHGSVH